MKKKEIFYFIKYLVMIPIIELKKLGLWFYNEMKWFNRSRSLFYFSLCLWFVFYITEQPIPAKVFLGLTILFFIKSELVRGKWKHDFRKSEELKERERTEKFISMEELENGNKKD